MFVVGDVLPKLKVPTHSISFLLQLQRLRRLLFACSSAVATLSCMFMHGASKTGEDVDAVIIAYVTDRHFGDALADVVRKLARHVPAVLEAILEASLGG